METIKKIAVFLANDFEETEAVATIDILRRGNIKVDLVSLEKSNEVIGSHNISINAEINYTEFNSSEYDGFFIPGGAGVDNLFENKFLIKIINEFNDANKIVSAICAAPQLLAEAGILDSKNTTVYPGFHKGLDKVIIHDAATIVDGNIITGQSIGTVIPFALELVKIIKGQVVSDTVRKALVIK